MLQNRHLSVIEFTGQGRKRPLELANLVNLAFQVGMQFIDRLLQHLELMKQEVGKVAIILLSELISATQKG